MPKNVTASPTSDHYTDGRFYNIDPSFPDRGFGSFLKWKVWDTVAGKRRSDRNRKTNIVVQENDGAFLRKNKTQATITYIGHATTLLQIDGINILTDPNFFDVAGWTDRSSPPGIALENLPPIDIVLISHNHYDHLSTDTIKALGNGPTYLVPLKVKEWFDDLNIQNVHEFDWWGSKVEKGITCSFVPARHFSKRGLFDANKSLWGGWIIQGKQACVYFAGDTGYDNTFLEIGKRFPHIDVALLPIGAYDPEWFMQAVHLNPEEAVQAFIDSKAKHLVPIHWGTFKLADEPLDEPVIRFKKEIERRNIPQEKIWMLQHGETHIFPGKE